MRLSTKLSIKRSTPLLMASLMVLALSPLAAAAKLIYSDSFETDLAKWGIGVDRVALSGQAAIFKGLAKSGASCLEFKCVEGEADGTTMFLPDYDLKAGYVEIWFYDKTGDRSAFVDQAYLVVGGPGGEAAGTGWTQLGINGNPARTEDQTRYAAFLGTDWLSDLAKRTQGWRKLGVELVKGGLTRMYIDDKLQGEQQIDAFETLGVVGFLSYFSGDRAGAEGVQLRESYWDDLKIYDSKP